MHICNVCCVCICPCVPMQRHEDMNTYMKIRVYTNRPILYLWVGLPERGDGGIFVVIPQN